MKVACSVPLPTAVSLAAAGPTASFSPKTSFMKIGGGCGNIIGRKNYNKAAAAVVYFLVTHLLFSHVVVQPAEAKSVHGDMVSVHSDFIHPLTPNMDRFRYHQVGLCDAIGAAADDAEDGHHGQQQEEFLIGLNVTSREVCSMRLSADQVKAMELLIDYDYYARFLTNSSSPHSTPENANAKLSKMPLPRAAPARLHMDHFLGVRQENLAHYAEFMKMHGSEDAAYSIPRQFRFGQMDPSQPSYWIYTHKAFVFYFDPDTREVLDALVEVNDLQLVHQTTDLVFHHSVFWLPRKAADFVHLAVPPSGMEEEFAAHPWYLAAPLVFSFLVFIVVTRASSPELEDLYFGDEYEVIAARHSSLLRWAQKQFVTMANRDPLGDDPVFAASASGQSTFWRDVAQLALCLGCESLVLVVSFVGFEQLRGDYFSDGIAFQVALCVAGLAAGYTWALLCATEESMEKKMGNDFFVAAPFPGGSSAPFFPDEKKIGFSRGGGGSTPEKCRGDEHATSNMIPLRDPLKTTTASAWEEATGESKSSTTSENRFFGPWASNAFGLCKFTLFKCLLNCITYGTFLKYDLVIAMLATNTAGMLVGFCMSCCTKLVLGGGGAGGTSALPLLVFQFSGRGGGGRVPGAFHFHDSSPAFHNSSSRAGMNNYYPGGKASSFWEHQGTSNGIGKSWRSAWEQGSTIAGWVLAVAHACVVVMYTVDIYQAVLRHELFLALTVPDRKFEAVVTLLIWAGLLALWSSFCTLVSGAFFKNNPVSSAAASKAKMISTVKWQLCGSGLSGLVLLGYFFKHSAHEPPSVILTHFCTFFGFFVVLFPCCCFFITYCGCRFVLNGVVRPAASKKNK
eukprot:g13872.t1